MRARRDDDAVLSGTGCVTVLGRDVDVCLEALAAGRSALRTTEDGLPAFATVPPPLLQSEVPDALETQIKFLNGAGLLAVDATAEAMAVAGLLERAPTPERRGLFLAQLDSDAWSCHEFRPAVAAATEGFTIPLTSTRLNEASARRVKPFFMLESLKNNVFSFLATLYELRGTNVSIAGFGGSTHVALDMAVRALAHNRLDAAVLVGAACPTSGVARLEMARQGILEPPGDAAAALVLERRGEAAARGDMPPAILGWGAATEADADAPWRPSSAALAEATRQALDEADLGPGDLAAVIAPGLGETGLAAAVGDLAALADVPLIDWTPAMGHTALATLPLQLALASQALRRGSLPGLDDLPTDPAVLILDRGIFGHAGAVVLA